MKYNKVNINKLNILTQKQIELKTEKEILAKQLQLKFFRGKLQWNGNIDKMRIDNNNYNLS